MREAPYLDARAESFPAVSLDQVLEHGFEGDSVEWIGAPRLVHRELDFVVRIPSIGLGATGPTTQVQPRSASPGTCAAHRPAHKPAAHRPTHKAQ